VILIPDHWYLRAHGYDAWIRDIDIAGIRHRWETKNKQSVFRGADSGRRRVLIENLKELENSPYLDIAYNVHHTDKHVCVYDGINCRTSQRIRRVNKNRSTFSHAVHLEWENMIAYRGIVDLDGFSNSWPGTFWKLRSNSVVLKQESPWCQWYYNRLVPFVHYIPIKDDLSDIEKWAKWVANDSNAESSQMMSKAATVLIGTLSSHKALYALESRTSYGGAITIGQSSIAF